MAVLPAVGRSRHLELGDAVFAAFLVAYGLLSLRLIPYDFTDLCYLFSLEQGRWVTQEWVHPIWVPTLAVLRAVLGLFGYHGRMLVPVEAFNIALLMAALAVLYRLARVFPGASLPAAIVLAVTAFAPGFWSAAVRPTPYAAALLFQALSFSLIIAEGPASPRRYAGAGAVAGIAMGFHASAMAFGLVAVACALWEPQPAPLTGARRNRALAFAAGMVIAAIGCWLAFVLYYDIGVDYFRNQDFRTMFEGIEQTPRTSIYTSQSARTQLTTFLDTFLLQGRGLLDHALALILLALLVRLWARAPITPRERRLAIATAANVVAISGFFAINGTRNGFIFAALALVPVWIAVTIRGSLIGVAALVLLTVPGTMGEIRYVMNNDAHGPNDPLLTEVQFLRNTLGPRDVVLTPGSPFVELFYLSHLNVLEVAVEAPTHPGTDVPMLHPGPALYGRAAWWRDHGSRILYALGDETTDFQGDVSGAEKGRQIFWRPEAAAADRAPKLQAIRAAVEASGLELHAGPRSPGGQRYAEIRLRDNAPASASTTPLQPSEMVTPHELHRLFLRAAAGHAASPYPQRAQFLVNFENAIPGDPWLACDTMELVCEGRPARDGSPIPCQRIAGCDRVTAPGVALARQSGGVARGCFWGPVDERQPVDDYLRARFDAQPSMPLVDWGFEAHADAAEMVMRFARGTVTVKWKLAESCAPGPIEARRSGELPSQAVGDEQLRDLVEHLPIPKVRPGGSARS